ncbi:PREDICTED: protein FAR1-RELATED SEQUENCE 5-like isoform X2 [Nelumbo nucifera]|nr:PREDICTED: protein FAR1-RELATED SEQUENCE 5-like isoform X2 [Nelumbo nucifera]XP_010257334.1 PREDICTED: protein FAR1-RELATED SEQUENCE 5-like isoform X2 [Nelumbo nucifera]XP_010257335.1 PREDICTED: protein FAR1-RELATED SEQUENCE 5-like isoform X2 [Nelumbo nucifera]XP_019053373.1 PREDICTED: protein FAR1-RELATED SEQUENCE 5-like isoform X2 [Nelumbo nucifera]XP_019053374.1 PREDICTED: protein FAR1-RELATED SEQUENCE 5-like isoform X2 [Nelumbo nucifera]
MVTLQLQFDSEGDHQSPEPVEGVHQSPEPVEGDGNEPNSSIKEPFVDMEFESETHAYNFYNEYAMRVGFSVRKDWKNKNREGCVTGRRFVCSREGFRRPDPRDKGVRNTRKDTRCGCGAYMTIAIRTNGKYYVSQFEKTHNHEFVTLQPFLRPQKKFTKAQAVTDLTDDSRTPNAAVDSTGRQVGCQENVGFLRRDYNYYLHTKRMTALKSGEAAAVLQYFQHKQQQNSSFFYAIQLDVEDKITNIFWANLQMVVDYEHFGDVVCFDTTYKTNKEGWPFGLFVGVNHHKQSIVFGGALLYDETTESFEWLLHTFVKAMSGKMPRTIITDQGAAMANAIKTVLPTTDHRICVWHMYQNALKNISHAFRRGTSFGKEFNKCIYEYEEEDEFLQAWKDMLEKYDLKENSWLQRQFSIKEKWAMAYGRNTFCADMKTTQRTESLRSALRRHLNSDTDLIDFLKHFEQAVEDHRSEELQADFQMSQSDPRMIAPVKMLIEASKVYTHAVFEKFQEEYKKFLACDITCCGEVGTVSFYKVTMEGKPHEHMVTYDSANETLECSCKKFEFDGVLCCHAIKVLNHRNLKVVPQRYILKRWTKFAKVGIVENVHGSAYDVDPNLELLGRYQDVYHRFVKVAERAAESKEAYKYVAMKSQEIMKEVENIISKENSRNSNVNTSKGLTLERGTVENTFVEGEHVDSDRNMVENSSNDATGDVYTQPLQVRNLKRKEGCSHLVPPIDQRRPYIPRGNNIQPQTIALPVGQQGQSFTFLQ